MEINKQIELDNLIVDNYENLICFHDDKLNILRYSEGIKQFNPSFEKIEEYIRQNSMYFNTLDVKLRKYIVSSYINDKSDEDITNIYWNYEWNKKQNYCFNLIMLIIITFILLFFFVFVTMLIGNIFLLIISLFVFAPPPKNNEILTKYDIILITSNKN